MLSGLLSIGQLLPIALIVVIVVCVFESCWRKCPPDKLMIVSGAGKMRSVSGKGTFVIPGFQRVDMLALGAVQAAEADLYKRTKQAEAARIERQNQSDAELYSAQKDAEGIKAKATAEAEATRLKGEADGAYEKSRGEGIAAGVKAQALAYNGMENPYLLANRYIDIMPKVAEEVAKPLTAVDSIKMYGSGNAQKLVKETTTIVDQVASGLKDSTGVDLPSLLSGLLAKSDMDAGSAESLAD